MLTPVPFQNTPYIFLFRLLICVTSSACSLLFPQNCRLHPLALQDLKSIVFPFVTAAGNGNTVSHTQQHFVGFFYLLTSAVNRNINIYKQEDGSGTLTQREPITLVTCYKTIKYTQNFTTYNFKYQTRI